MVFQASEPAALTTQSPPALLADMAAMANVASGDIAAFEAVVERHQPLIYRYLRRNIEDVGLVEELTNDVLLAIWQHAQSYAGRAKLGTWIIGIARRLAANAVRGQRLTIVSMETQQLAQQLSEHDSERDEGLQEQSARATCQQVHCALSRLKADHRNAIQLSFFAGYGYGTIADILDCPQNTVKTRVYHAKRQLQRLLDNAERPRSLSHAA